MKKVSITEAKNRLSALIHGLKGGAPVLILDRGRPVARLEPVTGNKGDQQGRLARLARDGTVRPGRSALPRSFFAEPLPRLKNRASAVAALLEERRDGR
jgi:antitoxin (DNA-binding transcriptional repressor) of toxin-antitoxin stability system